MAERTDSAGNAATRDPAVTLRALTATEVEDAEARVESWMALPLRTIARTFPLTWRTSDDVTHVGAFSDQGELVAHAARRGAILRTSTGSWRIDTIGSVATDPGHRGRGLAGALLAHLGREARDRGVQAAMLWSADRALYVRAGFEPAGVEVRLKLDPRRLVQLGDGDCRSRPATLADLAAIAELHAAKPWGFERSDATWLNACAVDQLEAEVLERDGRVCAYALRGKGADFPGTWHEVGGTDLDVLALLAASAATAPADLGLFLPAYRPTLLEALGPAVLDFERAHAALVRTLACDAEATALGQFFVDGLDGV